MKTYPSRATLALVLLAAPLSALATDPIIPPTISSIAPAGMQRGTKATFMIEGRNLSGATEVLFDAPGISATFTEITEIPEKIAAPKAGEDLGAQVPLGKKQFAKIEVTVAGDVEAGIRRFRIKTPLGTSNMLPLAVGTLPEVKRSASSSMEMSAGAQPVALPATLIGSIDAPGAKDVYQFDAKAGEDLVFQVQASAVDSKLDSALSLADGDGHILASAGENTNRPDAVLAWHVQHTGKYTITIGDRDNAGGKDYFYRLNAGALPYIKSIFPLGARSGQSAKIVVDGINLGGLTSVDVQPPPSETETMLHLASLNHAIRPVNDILLAADDTPETPEQEPNDTLEQAQTITLPVTINGHIAGGHDRTKEADSDYFHFSAKKGQRLNIEVAASRLGSSLDSVIEVLDSKGNAIPRATIRCLNETTTTLSDRDSRAAGIRIVSTSGLHENDYLMVGDELNRIDSIPDQPDADTMLKSLGAVRVAYLGTSPDVHAVNTPVYKAQILPPDATFPSNGLPVFRLNWRNDDGGPGYASDSMLDFVVPADGDYFLHLNDVRGMEGPDFSYRLTLREQTPDFRLAADPANPNIPRGGTTPVAVSLDQISGFDGPIDISVKGLPPGVTASEARILPGKISTTVVLTATEDANEGHPVAIEFVGHASVDGHEITRIANQEDGGDQPLQLASITPAPDVTVTTEAREVALSPGKEVTVKLNIARHNGFAGRVPCSIENLPPGVRVVNVGLNGVLVTEAQTSRTFTLHAEDWAKPIKQPIYVVGVVESNASTSHPSLPIVLSVTSNNQAASNEAASSTSGDSSQTGRPNR